MSKIYAFSVIAKAKEQVGNAYGRIRLGGAAGVTMAMMSIPTMVAHAESAGTSTTLLDGEVWTAITAGFGDLAVTCTQVLAIATVTGISIVGMTAAAKYAMKKIKGVLASAA